MNRCATCTDYSKTTVPPRISNASPCASHCIHQCLLTAPATLSGAPRPTRHDNRSNAKRTRTSNKTTHLEHITESIRLIPNREQEPCGLCPLSALTSPLMPRPRRAAAPHVCTYVLPQSPTPSTMTSFSQIRTPGPPAITSDRASPPHPTHAAAPFPCQQCQPARPRALLVQMTCARGSVGSLPRTTRRWPRPPPARRRLQSVLRHRTRGARRGARRGRPPRRNGARRRNGGRRFQRDHPTSAHTAPPV